jgi:hypothetical protein
VLKHLASISVGILIGIVEAHIKLGRLFLAHGVFVCLDARPGTFKPILRTVRILNSSKALRLSVVS